MHLQAKLPEVVVESHAGALVRDSRAAGGGTSHSSPGGGAGSHWPRAQQRCQTTAAPQEDTFGSGGGDRSGGGGRDLPAEVGPGGWAVLVEHSAWEGHVVLMLGPGKGRFVGLSLVMHLDGATYHVRPGSLRPQGCSPAAIPEPMRRPLLRTRTGGAGCLRLRELVNGLKAESARGERGCAGGAKRRQRCPPLAPHPPRARSRRRCPSGRRRGER